jgi:Alpha-kinase family
MVAKESRLVLEENGVCDENARKKFVKTFCSTQQLARRLACEFNEKLEQTRRVHRKTPKVSFLDCSIYQLEDKNLGKLSVLVEDKLDHFKWHKWNSNIGYVEGTETVSRCYAEKTMGISIDGPMRSLDNIGEETRRVIGGRRRPEIQSSDSVQRFRSGSGLFPLLIFGHRSQASCM